MGASSPSIVGAGSPSRMRAKSPSGIEASNKGNTWKTKQIKANISQFEHTIIDLNSNVSSTIQAESETVFQDSFPDIDADHQSRVVKENDLLTSPDSKQIKAKEKTCRQTPVSLNSYLMNT